MNGPIRQLVLFVCVLTLSAWSADPAAAQTVEVTSGGEKVIVDGDLVRIEGASGVTVVEGDWRRAGTVRVSGDTEQILVDLGAVTAEDRIQLTLGEDVLFDFDSDAIRSDAAANLGKVAQVIRTRSVGDVYVMGHTDSIGSADYNKKLSRRRAVAVMSWLNRNEGIPADAMVGVGMGATRPIAHNTNPDGSDNPEGRARNRRVEIQMATREGVRVGPAVVIGPGGVRVDETGVSVGAGAVRVDAGGVKVGGVEVGAGGVRVGGVTVGGGVSGERVVTVSGDTPAGSARSTESVRIVNDEFPSACAVGEDCAFACPYGDCIMKCKPQGNCDFSCVGGDCLMDCNSSATCNFSCSGGDCGMKCEPGATCDFSCSGGDCRFHCLPGADCRAVTCTGDDCVCVGAAC